MITVSDDPHQPRNKPRNPANFVALVQTHGRAACVNLAEVKVGAIVDQS